MAYTGPDFVNDGPPAINAANLNGMVEELERDSILGDETEDIRIGATGTIYSSAGNAVRGQFSELKNAAFNSASNPFYLFKKGSYINLSGETADISNPVADLNMEWTILDCSVNDKFIITARTTSTATSTYAWLDSSNNILGKAHSNFIDEEIIAPENAVKLIVQNRQSAQANPYVYKNTLLITTVNEIIGNDVVDAGNIISGWYVNYNTGIFQKNVGYNMTGFIPIVSEKIVHNTPFKDSPGIAFFDENRQYISGLSNSSSGKIGKTRIDNVPSGAVYMVISIRSDLTLSLKTKGNMKNAFNNLRNAFDSVNVYEMTSVDLVESQFINKSTGFPVKHSSYIRTTYIKTNQYKFVSVYARIASDIAFVFYGKDKLPIQIIKEENIETYGYHNSGVDQYIFAIPKDAYYFIASMATSDYTNPSTFNISFLGIETRPNYIRVYDVIDEQYEKMLGNVMCIGDSLTAGYTQNVPTYPSFLHDITGLSVQNIATSGYSAKDWWDNYGSVTDFTSANTFIVWLGTNNGLTSTLADDVIPYNDYSDYADTETGCYCKILSKIINDNPTAKIYLGTVYATEGNLNNTIKTIYDIANLERYEDNIIGVINNHDDVFYKNPDIPQDVAMHPYDGLHFGRVGNLFVAEHWIDGIRNAIWNNMQMYAR